MSVLRLEAFQLTLQNMFSSSIEKGKIKLRNKLRLIWIFLNKYYLLHFKEPTPHSKIIDTEVYSTGTPDVGNCYLSYYDKGIFKKMLFWAWHNGSVVKSLPCKH